MCDNAKRHPEHIIEDWYFVGKIALVLFVAAFILMWWKGDAIIAREQVDAAVGFDLLLIPGALPFGIVGHAVEDVDVFLLHVHQMVEEVVVHEIPVALVMLVGQAQVFVHVEGHHVFEGHFAGLIHPGQLLINADGAGAGGQAQHEGPFFLVAVDFSGNVMRGPEAHLIVIFLNDDTHGCLHSFLFGNMGYYTG